jgi:hypothetical protein
MGSGLIYTNSCYKATTLTFLNHHRVEITTLKGKVLHHLFLRGNFFRVQDPFRDPKNFTKIFFFSVYTGRAIYNTMNELYTQTEQIRGRWYRYDPDRDIWYPIKDDEPTISRWAWVAVVIWLAVGAYWLEYMR